MTAAPDMSTLDLQTLAEAKGLYCQRVTWVHHWTEGLFSFRIERPQSFRFVSGEFVMIGLAAADGRPLLRAYSIVSPAWEEHIEFFSVKVKDGALTSRLQHLEVGDHILLGRKTTGTLVPEALEPGKHLLMIGTGTGLAPFLSILREPDTHERFEHIVIAHTVRQKEDLAYHALLDEDIRNDEIFGELLQDRFTYYPTVTRGNFHRQGRITDRIRDGSFGTDIAMPMSEIGDSRWMICGSIAFNQEMIEILEGHGLREGTRNHPGQFVVERAFVG